jgi:hypothetical protein
MSSTTESTSVLESESSPTLKQDVRKEQKKKAPKRKKPANRSNTSSSRAKQGENYVVDTFDVNKPINYETDVCAMCKEVLIIKIQVYHFICVLCVSLK